MKNENTQPQIIKFNEYKYVFLDYLEGELGQEALCERNKNGEIYEHISQVWENTGEHTVDNALAQAKVWLENEDIMREVEEDVMNDRMKSQD